MDLLVDCDFGENFVRDVECEHQTAVEFVHRLHVARPEFELVSWHNCWIAWIEDFSAIANVLKNSEDLVKQQIVEWKTLSDANLLLELDGDKGRLSSFSCRLETCDFLWQLVWKSQNATIEDSDSAEDWNALIDTSTNDLDVVADVWIEQDFILEDAFVWIAFDKDAVAGRVDWLALGALLLGRSWNSIGEDCLAGGFCVGLKIVS